MNKLAFLLTAAALVSFSLFLMAERSHNEDIIVEDDMMEKLNQWNDFKTIFGKSYTDAQEEAFRMKVFWANLDLITSHNAKRLSYQMAVNSFADLTNEEFKAIYLGFKMTKKNNGRKLRSIMKPTAQNRSDVDWTAKGAVQPVKDQGACGSCWAFSAVGSVEGTYAISKSEKVNLSEQQLVSCSGDYGNYGCDGGLMDSAFEYIIDGHPLALNEQYPYKSTTGKTQTCKNAEEKLGKYTVGSYYDVEENNPDDLFSSLLIQPVSVAVDASTWSFYSGGVMLESQCDIELNHGVLLTGYVDNQG